MLSLAPAILVIGDVMLDIIVAPSAAIETGSDTPAAIELVAGGSGANQAAWLGYFGIAATLAARVGSDGYDWHVDALRAHGVEPCVARDDTRVTGRLVSLISAGGERSFLTDRGANARLERADLPDAVLDRVGLVHVSGYALSEAGSRAAVLAFLDVAIARGLPITVDPGSTAVIRAAGAEQFFEWTRSARVCFPNALEAAALAGTSDPAAQLVRLGARYETVVIKAGAAGAFVATGFGERCWSVAASPAVPLDTTGAGDAFVAGYLAAYMRGADPAACVQRGVAAGTAAVTRFGGRPPLVARPLE